MRAAHRPSIITKLLVGLAVLGSLLGCKDLTGSTQLPAGTQNPAFFNTPAGALGMRSVVLQILQQELPKYLVHTGLLTDEVTRNEVGVNFCLQCPPNFSAGDLDSRVLPEQGYPTRGTDADDDYNQLQRVRGLATQALGALVAYDTGTVTQGDPIALRSQLYAMEGYVEILLADFFCSGIPLSTLDFQRDFTYHAGSTTDQVYQDAIAKLDSAALLAGVHDSIGLQYLAAVLKGRAWLARDQYDSAAAAVASVPTGFQYQIQMNYCGANLSAICSDKNFIGTAFTISNSEGQTGLPYLSDGLSGGDPRVAVDTIPRGVSTTDVYSIPIAYPQRYDLGATLGFAPFTVADGIEARLIQAEAALHDHPTDTTWLGILNTLRATANVPGTMQPATAQQLPRLTDPGTAQARVALLFKERAYWLFLTGHRQGDLRRLVRQYGRQFPNFTMTAYPTGSYLVPSLTPFYGTDVTAPIPSTERINPQFHGCLSRSA